MNRLQRRPSAVSSDSLSRPTEAALSTAGGLRGEATGQPGLGSRLRAPLRHNGYSARFPTPRSPPTSRLDAQAIDCAPHARRRPWAQRRAMSRRGLTCFDLGSGALDEDRGALSARLRSAASRACRSGRAVVGSSRPKSGAGPRLTPYPPRACPGCSLDRLPRLRPTTRSRTSSTRPMLALRSRYRRPTREVLEVLLPVGLQTAAFHQRADAFQGSRWPRPSREQAPGRRRADQPWPCDGRVLPHRGRESGKLSRSR